MLNKNSFTKFVTLPYMLFLSYIVYSAITDSTQQLFQIAKLIPFGDKFAHVILIGTLTIFLNLSFPTRRLANGISYLSIFLFMFFMLEECSQSFFVNRTADFFDFLSNTTGILLAELVLSGFQNCSKDLYRSL